MADAFTPRFVDLVRNYTTTVGTGDFVLGPAVNGYAGFGAALNAGDAFYYSCVGVDKPAETEVGRGRLTATGSISRDPIGGTKTNFSSGTKSLALIAASEWFDKADAALGAVSVVVDRGALAAATGASTYLCESGREGRFVFDPADLSAAVAADSAQGIFIAPASDPAGAGGAWVRRWEGPIDPAWFGIVEGDAAGANAVANDAAWISLASALAALAVNSLNNRRGVWDVRFGIGHYEFSAPLDCNFGSITISGRGSGKDAGAITRLKFIGSTGIRIQNTDTSGGSIKDSVAHTGAGFSVVRDISIEGDYTILEAENHGIHARAPVYLGNVQVRYFAGDGVRLEGNANGGTADSSIVRGVRVFNCRNGFYSDGADANVISFSGCMASSNRQWGYWESGFLGNHYSACHAATNGLTDSHSTPSMVSYGGNLYYVIAGQEAWCSANPPSGVNSDNQGWAYKAGGNVTSTHPAWAAGTIYRAGGSFYTDNINAPTVLSGCYAESDQPLAQISWPAIVIGGILSDYVWKGSSGLVQSMGGSATSPSVRFNYPVGTANNQVTDENFGASFGTNNGTKTALQMSGSVTAPSAHRLKYSGADIRWDYGNLDSAVAFWITGPNTSVQFGTGVSWAHGFHAPALFVSGFNTNGNIAQARRLVIDTAAPTGGNHGQGEFCLYRGGANPGLIGWQCTGGGSPGTWAAHYSGYSLGPIGYQAGAGGAVTQATSKSAGVTKNVLCGQITMNAAALAAGAMASFTVTNNQVAATDAIILNLQSGSAAAGAYRHWVDKVSAGSFVVAVENRSAGSLSEALVFNFAVVKAVAA